MLAILKTTPTGLERLERFESGSWIDLLRARSNGAVLTKLLRTKSMKIYEEDEDLP